MSPTAEAARERGRNLLFLTTPALWPVWPFLPLMRRRPGCAEECGLLYDALHRSGAAGFSATVILALCGAPHKASYADWMIGQSLLDVLL
jgi:hypothetical protein